MPNPILIFTSSCLFLHSLPKFCSMNSIVKKILMSDQEHINRFLYPHKSLPKVVAKDIVESILSETISAEIDNKTICKRINLVIRNWTCFASYWTKDVVIDEELDPRIIPKFKNLSVEQQRYLAIESNFAGLVPPSDRDTYYDYLDSLEGDDVWKANLRLKKLCTKADRVLVNDCRSVSESIEKIKVYEDIMKKEMNTYLDGLNVYNLQFVSSTILKVYLKYGHTSLAESLIDLMNPILSTHGNWFIRGRLTYFVVKSESNKINELKNEFIKLNKAEGTWNERESEIDFYSFLCLRYFEVNNHLGLMKSIDKLVQLNKNLQNLGNYTQTWRWTNLFNRSRQNSFFTGPYNYEFRFSLYKTLLDNGLTQGGFALVVDVNLLSLYNRDCCAPTVLLDLCLEALLISVTKYEEAYNLCIELIVRNNFNTLTRYKVEKDFSLAFDAYIHAQNQKSNVKIFSAYQRFKDSPEPEIRLTNRRK